MKGTIERYKKACSDAVNPPTITEANTQVHYFLFYSLQKKTLLKKRVGSWNVMVFVCMELRSIISKKPLSFGGRFGTFKILTGKVSTLHEVSDMVSSSEHYIIKLSISICSSGMS